MKASTRIGLKSGFAFIFAVFLSGHVSASTLFEGWYEILVNGKKAGFSVQRYEFTNGKFISTSYLKTNMDGNDVTESLKAEAGPGLEPLKYSYTTKYKDTIKIIDATFKGQVATLSINDGKKTKKETKRIEKGTFLSTFLVYLLLSQKDGIKMDANYHYSAIAEEDGKALWGDAAVMKMDKVKDREAYKIENKFKDDTYFTWMSPKGEVLYLKSPDRGIEMRFSDNQANATKGVVANMKDLTFLFGTLPGEFGAKTVDPNTLAPSEPAKKGAPKKAAAGKKTKAKAKPSEPEQIMPDASTGKPGDAPAGQGLEIKGVPPPKSGP